MNPELYGVVAIFSTPEAFLAALRQVRREGYSAIEANVPFAIEGMDEELPGRPTPMARIVLTGALLGAGGGYFMQWFATRDYAFNVGGRPLHSWPAFIPITFELAVLTAALVGVAGLLWLARLPRLDHPLFRLPEFSRASQDRYFLTIQASDPHFQSDRVHKLLASLHPEKITEVRT